MKIMTFNIHNYDDGDVWNERISMVVNIIASNQPDIIALQEIRFDPDQMTTQLSYQNMAEQILYKLQQQGAYKGAILVFQPRMYYPSMSDPYSTPEDYRYYPLLKSMNNNVDSEKWEGLAIISRLESNFELYETGYRLLTNVPANVHSKDTDINKRNVQYAAFKMPSGNSLFVFNCHYSYEINNFLSNVRETLDYIDPFSNNACLLLGDLNWPPKKGYPGYRQFRDAGLYDLWELLYPGEDGITDPKNNQRIDYIWANSAIPQGCINSITRVGMESAIFKPGEPPVYASDHYGLIAEINIEDVNPLVINFLELMREATRRVESETAGALLVQVTGDNSGEVPNSFTFWFSIVQPDKPLASSAKIHYIQGQWSKVENSNDPICGAVYSDLLRIELSITDAVACIRDSGYQEPFTFNVLFQPLDTEIPPNPLYYFKGSASTITVDAVTGNVSNQLAIK